MFDKILIANRGEIACRIIRTAREMGVRTVAVFSDADAQALHVAHADEAVRIGPAPVADSYLRGDLIIQAALSTGAGAIHPGYGFLSENPDFSQAVADAGLVFIGPSPDAIRAMGLKDAAKALMEKAGVPVVPGYHGPNQAPEALYERAVEIGFPVLIKAVAGGGGKGMRLVENASDFQEALASAQSEAQTAFGNADVLIEKYIACPRHIEVQVFGDGKEVVHLYERDCSLQRRHQKVIEEAPAPHMPDAVRVAMCDAAVRAAKAINYAGAGTIEFIADASDGLHVDGFWFMEMNTRLQVEHPVTEAVTGVDLVDWQLRVAAGTGLPCGQSDIAMTGHAIEARLYAEDVPAGFLPATGQVAHLAFPVGPRIDAGVQAGDVVSPWYDPMIAKMICHGTSRETALAKLRAGLGGCQIAGVTTNIDFLRRLAREPSFVAGDVDTGVISRATQTLCQAPDPSSQVIAIAAVTASDDSATAHRGFTLWQPLEHTINLVHRDEAFAVQFHAIDPQNCAVTVGEDVVRLTKTAGGWGLPACREGRQVTVFGEKTYVFDLPDPLARAAQFDGSDTVAAPMPGLVRHVYVAAGQTVKTGDPLVVLEAMKMEHILRASRDGTVARVAVDENDQVMAGALVVALETRA